MVLKVDKNVKAGIHHFIPLGLKSYILFPEKISAFLVLTNIQNMKRKYRRLKYFLNKCQCLKIIRMHLLLHIIIYNAPGNCLCFYIQVILKSYNICGIITRKCKSLILTKSMQETVRSFCNL